MSDEIIVTPPASITVSVNPVTGAQGLTGPTGATGASGVISVTSPITNSGTSTSAQIGINQSLLSVGPGQVTGTALTQSTSFVGDVTGTAGATVVGTLPASRITDTALTQSTSFAGQVTGTSGNLVVGTLPSLSVTNTVSASVISATNMTVSASATAATDVTNKTYVDTVATGINAHDAVSYASTSGDTATILANANVTYNNNGTGVGATLTNANASRAALVLDGYTFTGTDATNAIRVLIKDAATSAYNGIYTVTNQGSASVNWVLTRATDSDQPPELAAGDFTYVLNGNTLAKFTFIQTSKITTVGTDAITWTVLANGNFGSVVAVNQGGTGATTAALALTSLGGASLTTANTFTAGQTITPSSGTAATINAAASGVGQIIKVNGADALRVRNNGDTSTVASIDVNGNIWGNNIRGGSGATDIGGLVSGLGYSTGTTKLAVFRGGSSGGVGTQYTDLMQFQTGATGNAVLGGINAVGQFYNGSTLPTSFATGGTIQSIATGANPLITTGSAHTLSVGDLVTLAGTTGGTYNGTFIVLSTPLTTTFTIATSLTTGQAGTGGTITAPAQASITARSNGTVGLTVSPVASTGTAEVARFYHTNGSTYSGFDNASRFFVRTSGITHGTPSLAVNTGSDTAIGAVIRGNSATQSADLQQWQNNGGTVLQAIASDGTFTGNVVTNAQTGTTYTLILADAGKNVEMNNASANTLTVPPNSSVAYPIGTQITVIQTGAGTTTIAQGSGVTVNFYSPTSAATRTIKGQWGAATLIKRATDTWVLIGNLT
jgi:collagen type VII alpha